MDNVLKEPILFPEPEKDIEEIGERVKEAEKSIEGIAEKEKAVKEEIRKYIEDSQKTPSFSAPVSQRDESEEIKKFQPGSQVGALISLVFQKGLKQAVVVARELDNPAVLDEFHDTLVDRYYQELVKRGILKF